MGYIQIWYHFFWPKKVKVFQWFLKFASLNFVTIRNSNKKHRQNQTIFYKTFQIWHQFLSVTKKYSISMIHEIKIYQLHYKSEHKPGKWNEIRCFSMWHIQIWLQKKIKKIKYGNDLTKSWSAAGHIRRRLGNTSTSSHVRFDI